MKIGGDIIGEDSGFIYRNRKVCHRHFEEIFIYPNMKLCSLAIPSLHIPGKNVIICSIVVFVQYLYMFANSKRTLSIRLICM